MACAGRIVAHTRQEHVVLVPGCTAHISEIPTEPCRTPQHKRYVLHLGVCDSPYRLATGSLRANRESLGDVGQGLSRENFRMLRRPHVHSMSGSVQDADPLTRVGLALLVTIPSFRLFRRARQAAPGTFAPVADAGSAYHDARRDHQGRRLMLTPCDWVPCGGTAGACGRSSGTAWMVRHWATLGGGVERGMRTPKRRSGSDCSP